MKRLRAAGTIVTPLAVGASSGARPTIKLSKGSDSSLRLEAALASRNWLGGFRALRMDT